MVSSIDVNVDTVYIRTNIQKIDTEDFKGWEYDEVQYNIREYIETLTNSQDAQSMAMLISLLLSEVDCMKERLDKLEGK